jgi:DNA-binding CsgD family transcriptional regulator
MVAVCARRRRNEGYVVAYHLGLSTSRVSLHLRNAMRKLGARTRAQLVKKMRDFQSLA